MEDNITQIRSGLHQDNSFIEQPREALRFALNAISETNEGDQTFIANEESNELCFQLPDTYIPLGQVYVSNSETVIFSVKDDETLSEIGIVDADCNYTTLVNADLGFTLNNQIDATFRLRRGCERTIYWVDPKIRFFNIDRPELFKTPDSTESEINDPTANWVINNFFLLKRYSSIPQFEDIGIEETGQLLPGSYNFAVQYLDSNLNPTEWITTTEVIPIYNDLLRNGTTTVIFAGGGSEVRPILRSSIEAFRVNGSSNIKNDYKDYPPTGKSIILRMSDLDTNFDFYRIAIIEATNGTGQISAVKFSAPISIDTPVFSYDGSNFESEGTIEEIQQFRTSLNEAKNIEQIENRLILGNVKNTNVNFCNLQRYASKIRADLAQVREFSFGPTVGSGTAITSTSKDPLLKVDNRASYTPGEIYSFGIQFFFEDNTISPVFHIPGRNPNYASDMDSDNELENTFYTDNSFCLNYWGVDSEGDPLEGQPVRHHRFPLRLGDFASNVPFSINFSNIEIPSLEDTNGLGIIAFQIVQQERTEENTTILDQAIMTPLIKQDPYTANSILITEAADNANIETDIFQFFSPQSKFKGSNINPDTVIKIGELSLFTRNKSSLIVQDVAPGTSYNPDVHRRRDRDNDGFDLHAYNMVYECLRTILPSPIFYASPGSANEVLRTFTLDSLEADGNSNLFNTITDNKSDFIQFDEPILLADANARAEFLDKIPIVVLKRTLSDPYANFRTEPYYYASQITPASNGQFRTSRVSDGDSFLAKTLINTTTFYDISLANRSRKKGIWNTIVGVLSVVAGAVLIATGVGAGAGLAAIGFGVSQIATGVKRANINKVLQEEYEKGLRTAVEDSVITPDFAASPNNDDEIRWFSNIITTPSSNTPGIDLESSVRVDLREGATKSGITDFLERTGDYLIANPLYQRFPLDTGDNDNGEDFITEQDRYILDKLTTVDGENNSGFVYKGFPNAELYELNPDYERINNAKIFFHLGLEYDCCSDCIEEFPYRVHYSQQSFQEELIDNYTSFLPNNFRDIEGEKGVINDIFKIQNNLYIHTEEALFHLPQNVQERVTGDIVSFIGTGDFFSIPPRKIVDHDKSSAGTLNKWSRVKTPYGVFFISLLDRTVYKFSGESLEPISNNGLFNWFKENIPFDNQDLFCDNIDNPSSILGLGYTSVYDSRKERVIFSKKDLNLDFAEITNQNDFKLSLYQGDIILFNDYQSIIDARVANGEIFEGIFEDKLRFRINETVQQTITRPITLPNNTDIHIFFDTSGSFGSGTLATIEDGTASECLVSINNAVEGWLSSFQGANPDWAGTVYKYVDSTERWLNYASIISSQTYGGVTADKDILVISFCNESQPTYHGATLSNAIAAPTAQFTTDYNDFTTNVFPSYNSFIGIHYPVVFGDGSSNCNGGTQTALESSKEFLLHSAAALEGIPYTLARLTEEGFDTQNQGFLPAEWTTLRTALQGANPYPDNGLSNFGWLGKWDVNADSSGNIITVADFQQDIDELLQGIESTEEIEVDVETFTIEEVQGENIGNQLQDIVSHSWTISYSLKDNSFTSWHSYLPSFYFFVNNEFFSWNQDIARDIYKHNVRGSYQSFYGTLYPHIIEYVSNSDVLLNKIFENMTLHTEAKIYDNVNDYFINNRDRTFNKAILYNSRQCSGELTLFNKDTGLGNPEDYFQNQVRNFSNLNIPIDNNEGIWTFNGFRDIVIDLSQPLFIKNIDSLQPTYYIDKILNDSVLDENKDWTQQESFRDKYLVVRLIFDNFTDTRLITNYSIESENKSYR